MNVRKMTLTVNGADRMLLCDSDRDSLADVIRRLGFTGTKIGCGSGQCGACSLLLDGKLVRGCVKKMKNVDEHARVETIEGIGTAEQPHPLQQAFVTYAAIQCGFCSPGFIMSAYALLQENPSPTREQVRAWFTKNRNLCRCTGYKPIVDAVMAAAEVMRGEKSMRDITYAIPADGRIYGTEYPKPTGMAKVLGACDFGGDIAEKMPAESLHLAVVLARQHHAKIARLDVSAAEAMPGVVKVVTAADVKGTNKLFSPLPSVRCYQDGYDRPVICADKAYRYGDVVAIVAAATREQARKAAAKVAVEYESLKACLSYFDAIAKDAPQIHDSGPNLYLEQPVFKGEDTRELLKNARHALSGSFSTSRQPHLTIEPETIQAYPEGDGVAIHCKSQFLFGNIAFMANAIGLPKDKIRLILNPAGASFGYSMSAGPPAMAAVCALALNRPVSMVLDWEEHQHVTGKRAPAYTNVSLACDENGKFVAMDYHVGVDHGAYSELAAALTSKICRFFGYPYQVPNIRGLVQTACSNHNYGTAYRSFGSPQAYMASEQVVDMLAEKAGIDPFEFRYINVAKPGDLCTNSVPYHDYPMEHMMDLMRPHYEAAVKRAAAESTPEVARGVGIAWGGYHVGKAPDHSEVDLELNEDGSVTHYSTWSDVGQGADIGAMIHTHEALRPLGIHPEQIRFVLNDTGLCPDTGSTSGSRSHHAAGRAIMDAAEQLIKAMRKDDGGFRTWQEMKDAGLPTRYRGVYDTHGQWPDLDPNTGHGWGAFEQNYCLFLAEVTVEKATGVTRVVKATIVADIGKVGSYQAVHGQIWGGFSHSIGYALSEDYDDVKKHATLLGAGIVQCDKTPDDFTIIFNETLRQHGPYGSTGCAEACQSAGHVAVLNAVNNAVGVRMHTLPATPEKIVKAMQAKAEGREYAAPAWELGCDLYERLEYLQANPKQ